MACARRSPTSGVAALKPRAARYAYARSRAARALRPRSAEPAQNLRHRRPRSGRQADLDHDRRGRCRVHRRGASQGARGDQTGARRPAAGRGQGRHIRDVAELWRKRHVEANGLRSAKEIARLLGVHVCPAGRTASSLASAAATSPPCSTTSQDNHSARQADYVLNVVRSIMNWFATRHDDYMPPIVRGMRRQNPGAQARARILDDDEIRPIWKAAEANGTFGAIVRMCLLTAQRRRKVAAMRWADISVDGEWTIPSEAREKDAAGTLAAAGCRVDHHPRAAAPWRQSVSFRRSRRWPVPRFQRGQGGVRRQVADDTPAVGSLHDLRRTARSLMSRAGVRPDIAERVHGPRHCRRRGRL